MGLIDFKDVLDRYRVLDEFKALRQNNPMDFEAAMDEYDFG